ncbi:MAG: sigma-70 family RNA polymerase sigma factor [Planctomycetota bacterium]
MPSNGDVILPDASTPDGSDATCWSLIGRAARADREAREIFVQRYYPVVASYLQTRWRGLPAAERLGDAVQDVFAECLRAGGVLERIDELRSRSFRGFLFGVVRNVARQHEKGRLRGPDALDERLEESLEADDSTASQVFDRAWARAVVDEALELQRRRARRDRDADRRIVFLRQRFFDGLPAREIARLHDCDPALVHRELSRGRAEFEECLVATLKLHLGTSDAARRTGVEMLSELLGS